jgi:hypothetical protein
VKSSFDRPYVALKCGLEWSFAGDSFFAVSGHQYSLANLNGDVQRMVLGSLMLAPLLLATVKMAQSRAQSRVGCGPQLCRWAAQYFALYSVFSSPFR